MKRRTPIRPKDRKQTMPPKDPKDSETVHEQLCLALVSSLLPFSCFQGNIYLGKLIGTDPPSEQTLWFQAQKLYDKYIESVRSLINSDQHKFALTINQNQDNFVTMNLHFYTENFNYCRIPLCFIKKQSRSIDSIVVRNTILQDLRGRVSSVCSNITLSESTQNLVKFLFIEDDDCHRHNTFIQLMSHLLFNALQEFLIDATRRLRKDEELVGRISGIEKGNINALVLTFLSAEIRGTRANLLESLSKRCESQLDNFMLCFLRPFINVYQAIVSPHESHQMLRYLRGLLIHVEALSHSSDWPQVSIDKLGWSRLIQNIQNYIDPLTNEMALMAYLSPFSINLLNQQELAGVSDLIGTVDTVNEDNDDSMDALDKAIRYTTRPHECELYESLLLEWRLDGRKRDTGEFWRHNGDKIPHLRALAVEKSAFRLSSSDLATEIFCQKLGGEFDDSGQEFDLAATIYYFLHILSTRFDLQTPNFSGSSDEQPVTLLERFRPNQEEVGAAVLFRYFVH